MTSFSFQLNDTVEITVSGERGTVIGRAEYTACENAYFLRMRGADGRAVEAWWSESALAPKPVDVSLGVTQ